MIKKIFIGSIIFFLAAICITGYMLFFKKSTDTPTTTSNTIPFGSLSGNKANDASGTSTDQGEDLTEDYHVPITKLMNISTEPVAGAVLISNATSSVVRSIARATGHITEVNLLTGTSSRISNTTIPKIYESLWFKGGNSLLIRYLDDTDQNIITYNGIIEKPIASSTAGSITGNFMPENISSITLSPDSKKTFFLVDSGHGAQGYVSDAQGNNVSPLWNSPISEWTAQWPEANTIALTTKPSFVSSGFLYFINTKSGAQKKILGNISGMITRVNPTAQLVAYNDTTLALSIYDIKTQTSVSTSVKTLAEKCVWSQKETGVMYCAVPTNTVFTNMPDDWYQGKISFTDEIYKIDTINKHFTQQSYFTTTDKQNFDMTNLVLGTNDDYIIFINKTDGSLWSYKLQP